MLWVATVHLDEDAQSDKAEPDRHEPKKKAANLISRRCLQANVRATVLIILGAKVVIQLIAYLELDEKQPPIKQKVKTR